MIKEFDYVNNRDVTSHRVVYVISQPSKFLAGIDLSELSEVQQGEYTARATALKQALMLEMATLNLEFDVSNRYRQFDPAKMTNTLTETT